MRRTLSRLAFTAGVATLLLTTAACTSAEAEAEPTSSQPVVTADPEESTATPEPEVSPSVDTEAAGDPTCDTIIDSDVVAEFENAGWTAQAETFFAGTTELTDGIRCTWGNFDGAATDQVLVYGWAPIGSAQATTAQTELIGDGWVREDGDAGIYITANPEWDGGATDDEGYGSTYLFGDGWVTFASTKQGLLLITWGDEG